MIRRAVVRELEGHRIRLASVEDLLLMKLVADREKDTADVRRLIRRHRNTIDRAYLKPRLEELAEALDRPGIARALDD